MGLDNALKFAASHELAHHYWAQLPEETKGKIIQDLKKRPGLQPFLKAFVSHPGYRGMGQSWFDKHKDQRWGFDVIDEDTQETVWVDARLVIDELFANRAWQMTDLDPSVLDATNATDDENKKKVREIAKQAALFFDFIIKHHHFIEPITKEYIVDSSKNIRGSYQDLITQLKAKAE